MSDRFQIILVDDEADVLESIALQLEDSEYQVVTFTSPQKALEYIPAKQQSILMIFSDFKMPEMNGLEFRQGLIDAGVSIPFSIVTAFFDKEMAEKGMELSVSSFIKKPQGARELEEAVEKFAASRKGMLEDDKEMIANFMEEADSMIEEIEGLILELEEDPTNMDCINTYFRLLHTIKGTAACLGLMQVSGFTHKYEDFVTLLKNGELPVTKTVTNILLSGFDQLKLMIEEVKSEFSDLGLNIEGKEALFIFDREEILAEVKGTSGQDVKEDKVAKKNNGNAAPAEKMSVSLDLLDNFMELSGEVTVLRNTILKSVKVIEELLPESREVNRLNATLEGLHKVTSSMQNYIADMRKVSLDSVFKPYKRVIRDIAKATNKEVNFEIVGGDNSVDTQVAKLLSGALIHVMRNSIDHGIEGPEKRAENGKKAEGSIILKAEDIGESIRVTVQDDGAGINKEIVKTKAIEKGLYTQVELDQMSDRRIFDILLESGFSTAQVVSDISGRGVGMDMVKSSVVNAGGRIHIESELGKGSTFVLEIPYPKSVLIITSLLVKISNATFVISMEDIAEVVLLEDEQKVKLQKINGSMMYKDGNHLIPIVPGNSVLEYTSENTQDHSELDRNYKIVVLRVNDFKFGLLVDEIIDLEEVVKRPLWNKFSDLLIYGGASLLGTGDVSLVIDPEGLAKKLKLSYQDNIIEGSGAAREEDREPKEYLLFSLEC
ncbi:MAG: response regulator, partial [Halobacteriovoraceae bacterium]|nr:response regulator [Halobacteriovoraceae bacterium]